MSHVSHVNKSLPIHLHVWLNWVTCLLAGRVNEACHAYGWVMSHVSRPVKHVLCTILQHTATHCNTPQHTATHCNTLQHTAIHCNTIQHTARRQTWHLHKWCNTPQHTATHCNTLQHTATHCNTLQHTATHFNKSNMSSIPILLLNHCWYLRMCHAYGRVMSRMSKPVNQFDLT